MEMITGNSSWLELLLDFFRGDSKPEMKVQYGNLSASERTYRGNDLF